MAISGRYAYRHMVIDIIPERPHLQKAESAVPGTTALPDTGVSYLVGV